MKVTTKTVSDRITLLENQKTLSINEENTLKMLRWGMEQFQRAEAAEAKLAELGKQEPAGKWIVQYSITEDGYDRHSFASWRGNQPENNAELFTRPAPAVSLAELVPDEKPDWDSEESQDIDYMEPSDVYRMGKDDGWNSCRAAILRNIEGKSRG